MDHEKVVSNNIKVDLQSDCKNCFGLCCVALPYTKSTDFAFSKDGSTPCVNLQSDYRCGIHCNLREKGFKGCTVYECFGAGQKVSQVTYQGKDWKGTPGVAMEMFSVFPLMQQLHEMLYYLDEALGMDETEPIYNDIVEVMEETKRYTELCPKDILTLDIPKHRAIVSELFHQVSELVRVSIKKGERHHQIEMKAKDGRMIGANLKGADLRGCNFRGALLIAAKLQNSDLRKADFIGGDLRDTDLSGANLIGSIFLTQAQVNAAKGNQQTKLPHHLKVPQHWIDR